VGGAATDQAERVAAQRPSQAPHEAVSDGVEDGDQLAGKETGTPARLIA
jgi:hypothetical protein